jgi:hypothetical protein
VLFREADIIPNNIIQVDQKIQILALDISRKLSEKNLQLLSVENVIEMFGLDLIPHSRKMVGIISGIL